MPGPFDGNLAFRSNATVTASGNLAGFNLGEGAEIRVAYQVTGTVSGTSPTLDVKLQDSADGSSYADAGVSTRQFTATDQHDEIYWRTQPGRPYVRLVETVGGTTPSFGGVYSYIAP